MYGIVGLLILVLDIFVIVQILNGGGDMGKKLLWIILVLILPLVGPLLYYVMGRETV
ncbi:hypothetical protein BH10PLA1_BH10PLA1_00420 [soil metagenome]